LKIKKTRKEKKEKGSKPNNCVNKKSQALKYPINTQIKGCLVITFILKAITGL
jgi:hypothetical protein